MLDILCSNPGGCIFSERKSHDAARVSDTLAKSKLSPERCTRIQAEAEQELLEMNLQELRKAAGITQAAAPAKAGMDQADVSLAESREDHRLSTRSPSKTQDR